MPKTNKDMEIYFIQIHPSPETNRTVHLHTVNYFVIG